MAGGRPRLRYAVEKVDTFPSVGYGGVFDLGTMMPDGREEMRGAGRKSDVEQRRRGVTESESLVVCPKKRIDTRCRTVASLVPSAGGLAPGNHETHPDCEVE